MNRIYVLGDDGGGGGRGKVRFCRAAPAAPFRKFGFSLSKM